MKRMTLTGLFGKTAAAEKTCPCCDGTGEHPTGFECYTCDSGGTVPAGTPDDRRCDGMTPDGGESHGGYGLICVYPHPQGLRNTAAEFRDPPKELSEHTPNKSWVQHRQYASEYRAQAYLPPHRISSSEEAQEIADKITKAADVDPITVTHDPGYNYSFQQVHPWGGRARIVLGNGGMTHMTLLHELAHHVDTQLRTHDPEEMHGASFHNHMLNLVRQHHPQGQAAEWQLKDSLHATDRAMRMGWKAHFDQPNNEANPEPTEKEKALPEPEQPKPLYGDEHHDPLTRDLANFANDNGDHYPKHSGGQYARFDAAKGPVGEQVIARSTDKHLSQGLSPSLIRPQHLEHWLTYHPDREGLKQRWTTHNGYDHFGDMLHEVYGDETHHTAAENTSSEGTVRMVAPEEYRKFHFPDYPNAKTLPALVRHFKKTDPDYFNKVRDDVQKNGFTTPILVQYKDPAGRPLPKPYVREGHHRAAVAHDLGLHLPVGDYDNETDFQRSRKGNADWFQKNERGPQGVSWGTEAALQPRQAAEDADDPGLIHRGLSIVLPEHIHRFVHDESQPASARAHMLLAHVRKAKPEITSEEAVGTTGGLGNYWSPRKEKAAEYGDQGGWKAYHEHEREHGCGDEYDGYGGCPSTHVLLHAGTPPEKSHWTESFREGEHYDPEVSWRLPVRSDAKLMVHGISWKQGHDNEHSSGRDYAKEKAEPYSRYDFLRPVKKRAVVTMGPGNEEHIGETPYDPDETWGHKGLWDQWHPRLQPTIHRHMALDLPGGHPAHDRSRPMADRARSIVDHVAQGDHGRGGVGLHWTDDPQYDHLATGARIRPGQTRVTLHAQTPPRHHIEDADYVLEQRGVRDWDWDDEKEVPLKRNAPVKITGVSWDSHDGPQHHVFDEPITKQALVHIAVLQDGDDIPSRLLNPHGHHVKAVVGGYDNVELVHRGELLRYASQETDPEHVKEVGTHVATSGEMEPLILHYHPKTGTAYLGEGNHRLRAAKVLGMDHVPVRVTRAAYGLPGTGAKTFQDHPAVAAGTHVPADIKPSDLGFTTLGTEHTAAYVPPGTMGADTQGHGVQMTTMDGWAHRDGSHGHDDGTAIEDRPVYTQDHTWLPEGRYWGPNSAQNDQRLFDGDHLRPEVRQDILERVGGVLGQYKDWQKWTRVYFAGSQAAQWLDQNGQGNGDFDILIGVDFEEFRDLNPQYEELDDVEIASMLTEELWAKANVKDYFFALADGREVGPFDRTFYVNARAWNIKDLHPYAAYNVTDDDWAVHPLQVPADWSAKSLPESYWGYAEALVNEIRAIGQLPPEERHRMAANLYEELHTHRADAFADGGHGLYDLSNVIEKYLSQFPQDPSPWDELVQWKNESPSGPEPWVPTTARRTTLTELLDPKTAAGMDGPPMPVDRMHDVWSGDHGMTLQDMHEHYALLDEDHLDKVREHWDEARQQPVDFLGSPEDPQELMDGHHRYQVAVEKGETHLPATYHYSSLGKTAVSGADYGGVMIAIVPPKKICKKLAQEGGEPVEAMHVTLAYMPDQDRRKAARELPELVEGWARTQKALTARIGGVGTFVNPGQHVLWASVDIPDGGPFRQGLVETLERHGYDVANDHGWHPHVTLDYKDDHIRFLPKVEPVSWDVTEIHVCIGDNWTAVPLG